MKMPTPASQTRAARLSAVEPLEGRTLCAAGALDTSFSGDGKTTTNLPGGSHFVTEMEQLSNGKLLVAGTFSFTAGVARLNADGSLDKSFGSGDGVATIFQGENIHQANDLAVQPDGKIVLVATSAPNTNDSRVAVARFNSDGTPDSSFGPRGDGLVIGAAAGAFDEGRAVTVLPGGKVLAVGIRTTPQADGSARLTMLMDRFNADGRPDTSFSGDGVLTFTVPGTIGSGALDIAAAPDGGGDFLVAGFADASATDRNWAIVRFNADGTLERSFGAGGADGPGVVTTDFGGFDVPFTLAVAPDGKFAAGGSRIDYFNDGELARYNADGSPDRSFGGDGKFHVGNGFRLPTRVDDIALLPDGAMVVVGDTITVRVERNGEAPHAYFPPGFANTETFVGGVVPLAGGKVLLASAVSGVAQPLNLTRLNADLTPDTSFGGGDGISAADVGKTESVLALARTPDNKTVALVRRTEGFGFAYGVIRYRDDGSVDRTFDLAPGATELAALAVQPDGKVLVAGRTFFGGGAANFSVSRLLPDGTADASFGNRGFAFVNVFSSTDIATAIALLPDGRIVLAGNGGNNDFALARFNPNGSLDRSFGGGDGVTTTNFGGVETVNAMTRLPDGRLVVVGSSNGNFAAVRYKADGSREWRVTTDFGGDDVAYGVAAQSDGKVVVAGRGGSGADFALARYTTAGALDKTFSGDGKVLTDFGGSAASPALADAARAVAVVSGGKIVAAGAGRGDFAIARYRPDGSLDSGFSGDGKATTGFARGEFDGANALLVLSGNKYLVGGYAGEDAGLARYLGS